MLAGSGNTKNVGFAWCSLRETGVEANDGARLDVSRCFDGQLLVANQPSDALGAGRRRQRTLIASRVSTGELRIHCVNGRGGGNLRLESSRYEGIDKLDDVSAAANTYGRHISRHLLPQT